MTLSDLFLLATLSAGGMAMIAGAPGPLKCALLLLANWGVSNLAVDILGFQRAPLVIAPADAVTAILIAGVAIRHHCRVGEVIFCLFVAGGIVHVAGFMTDTAGTWLSYAALNIIYLLSVLTVGGFSARPGLRRWTAWLNRKPRLAHVRR